MSLKLISRLSSSVLLAAAVLFVLIATFSHAPATQARIPAAALAESPSQILPGVITTVVVGASPWAVGVDSQTGYVYVANSGSNDVTVISDTNIITTLAVGLAPQAVAVNENTGYIYVANRDSNDITVLSGTHVITNLAIGFSPENGFSAAIMGVNPATGLVYVLGQWANAVAILSGTAIITSLQSIPYPSSIGINPTTGHVYIGSDGAYTQSVFILSGTQVITAISTGITPNGIGVNHDTGYVYVANYYWDRWGGKWSLTILSATEVITTLNVIGSAEISPIGVNATSGYIYVLDYYGGSTVLSGTQIVGPFLSGYSAAAITVDSINGYAYVTNYDNSDVAVVSGTQTVERVSVGNSPRPIGVNPVNGLAYVPIPGDGCVSILGNMLVPGSLTPSLLDSASEDLLIDFLKPVLTSTVPFSISPSVPFTVTWSPASDLATISHAPLAIGTRYTLHVLPGGQAVSGLGVAEWKFVYAYYPFHFFLPLIEK